MRRTLAVAILLALVAAGNAPAEIRLSDFIQVLGSVSNAARPVDNAVVVAFNLSTYYVVQTFTTSDGSFRLPPLPVGIYRIIAVKNGFVPAVATVLPNRKDHQVALRLKAASPEDARNAIWEIRRSLPSDVLRELDIPGEAEQQAVLSAPARLSGEMTSMAAVAGDDLRDANYAQTAVGVRGNLGRGWQIDFSGQLQLIDGDQSVQGTDSPLAESRGVQMQIRSSATDSYQIASTRNSWLQGQGGQREAVDLESHRFEWQGENTSVQVRYVAHENLFPHDRLNAQMIEVSGERRIQSSPRSDIDVFLRVGQENFTGLFAAEEYRTAAVSATGRFAVLPAVRLRYGMHTYVTDNRSEWAPETGAEFQVGRNTSFLVAALYKVLQTDSAEARLPSVVFLNQSGALSPRYRYSIGMVSGDDAHGRITAAANLAEIDSLVRVVFDDRFDQFWDAFFLESGDLYHDVTLSVRKRFGTMLLIDLSTAAGRAENQDLALENRSRSYITGTVQSLFRPSGTSMEVSYRQVEQIRHDGQGVYDTERLNFRMGQSLRLPLAMRLLLGVDLARAPGSPVLVDAHQPDTIQKRLVGGISLAF